MVCPALMHLYYLVVIHLLPKPLVPADVPEVPGQPAEPAPAVLDGEARVPADVHQIPAIYEDNSDDGEENIDTAMELHRILSSFFSVV